MLAMAACGGDDDESADDTTTTEAEETTTTEAETTTTDEASTTEAEPTTTAAAEPWVAHAADHRADPIGTEHEYECPPDGIEDSIWGTDIYTDDSSVCNAAVHAGVITYEEGGTVTIVLEGPQESYVGTERNGVTSLDYPSWPGSFSIAGAD
jgi:hypothetical protein